MLHHLHLCGRWSKVLSFILSKRKFKSGFENKQIKPLIYIYIPYIHIHICICVHRYLYIYMHIYVCMYECVSMYSLCSPGSVDVNCTSLKISLYSCKQTWHQCVFEYWVLCTPFIYLKTLLQEWHLFTLQMYCLGFHIQYINTNTHKHAAQPQGNCWGLWCTFQLIRYLHMSNFKCACTHSGEAGVGAGLRTCELDMIRAVKV